MPTISFNRDYILEDNSENRKLVRRIESVPTGVVVKAKRNTPPTEEQKQKFKRKFYKSIQKENSN